MKKLLLVLCVAILSFNVYAHGSLQVDLLGEVSWTPVNISIFPIHLFFPFAYRYSWSIFGSRISGTCSKYLRYQLWNIDCDKRKKLRYCGKCLFFEPKALWYFFGIDKPF